MKLLMLLLLTVSCSQLTYYPDCYPLNPCVIVVEKVVYKKAKPAIKKETVIKEYR